MIWYPIDSTEASSMKDQEPLALFVTADQKIELHKILPEKLGINIQ
jgi:hypothetical protein